jgi:hypothetical protein
MGQNFPSGLGAILINKKKNEMSIGEGVSAPRHYVQFGTLSALLFMSFEQAFKSTFWERETWDERQDHAEHPLFGQNCQYS